MKRLKGYTTGRGQYKHHIMCQIETVIIEHVNSNTSRL